MNKRVLNRARTLSLSLPVELLLLCDKIVDSEGISRSAFFSALVRKELKARGIPIPSRTKFPLPFRAQRTL